jgi:hypothetical protein
VHRELRRRSHEEPCRRAAASEISGRSPSSFDAGPFCRAVGGLDFDQVPRRADR